MDWLKICDEAGKAALEAIKPVFRTEKGREKTRIGAGGDHTMHMDDVAEKAAMQVMEDSGKSFILISEEDGHKQFGSDPECVILMDPLDGSTNAKMGFAHFAISIGVIDIGQTVGDVKLGYVKHLIEGTTWHATRGGGAFKDGEPIKTAQRAEPRYFAFDMPPKNRTAEMVKSYALMLKDTRYLREMGSAALNVCHVADGTFDTYYSADMRVIDYIAAILIAEEAGAVVSDAKGASINSLKTDLGVSSSILCSANQDIHKIVLQKIRGV